VRKALIAAAGTVLIQRPGATAILKGLTILFKVHAVCAAAQLHVAGTAGAVFIAFTNHAASASPRALTPPSAAPRHGPE